MTLRVAEIHLDAGCQGKALMTGHYHKDLLLVRVFNQNYDQNQIFMSRLYAGIVVTGNSIAIFILAV